MNVEVTGELNVVFDRQTEDLRLTGTLNTVRGTYRIEATPVFAKIFDVQEGTVTFPGTPGVNPNLSLQAVHRVRTPRAESIEITAQIVGTLENPRVTLRSETDPNISQSDLVSYLFIGMPSYAIGSGATSSSSFGQEQATSLGLTYITSGLQSLVQGTGLLDYVGLSAAQSTGNEGSAIQNTQIELGRYISPSMFVVVTQRLGTESGTTPNVRLEWRLTRTYRADLYIEDRFARAPSFGLSQIANARKAYGFLLYREWGY
jgi:autotransporter translocation and assembly factor TamB